MRGKYVCLEALCCCEVVIVDDMILWGYKAGADVEDKRDSLGVIR